MALSKTAKLTAVPPKEKKALSQVDLQEFRLRHQSLTLITHQKLLVEEAYNQWLRAKGAEYGVKGKFQINLQTGEISCQT